MSKTVNAGSIPALLTHLKQKKMNKCLQHLVKREPKVSPRLKHPRIGRDRTPIRVSIVIPSYSVHNLSDTALYRTHAYVASTGVFAVISAVEIRPADVLVWEGVRYKVIRVERIENGKAVQVRGVKWERLQG